MPGCVWGLYSTNCRISVVWRTRRRLGSVLSPEKALEGLSGSVRLHGTCRATMQSRRDAYWDKMAIAT